MRRATRKRDFTGRKTEVRANREMFERERNGVDLEAEVEKRERGSNQASKKGLQGNEVK